MRKYLTCWAAALCLLGSVSIAQAATVLVTFSGTANGSSERFVGTGPVTVLHTFNDEPFTATIEMDTNQGMRFDDNWLTEVTGSIISASFTSGTFTRTFDPSAQGILINVGGREVLAGVLRYAPYSYSALGLEFYSPLVPHLVDDAYSATGSGSGGLNLVDEVSNVTDLTGLGLTITAINVESAASAPRTGGLVPYQFSFATIPEPETWLLMIGGLGLVGAMLRRRLAQALLAG